MLDRAAHLEDRIPHIGRILRLRRQELLQIFVLDDEAARQRLVGVDIGRDRLDTGRCATANDADRRGWRDGHLAGKALHHAHVGRIGAGAAFLGQHDRGIVGAGRDVLEHLEIPRFRHGALKGDALLLQEGVEAHDPHADRAFAPG